MQVNVTFTPTAPTVGAVFNRLKVIITDSIGTVIEVFKFSNDVESNKIDNGDGSYTVPFTVNGVGVGHYTGTSYAVDQDGQTMGTPLTFEGDVTIEEGGAWFPQVTGAV